MSDDSVKRHVKHIHEIVKENRCYRLIGAAVIIAILVIVIIILARPPCCNSDVGDPIITSSSVCGLSNNPCVAKKVVVLSDGSSVCQGYAMTSSTPCSDQCVSDGHCSGIGYSTFEQERTEPYCIASNYSSCRGSCSTYHDCPDISFIGGIVGTSVCFSGSCMTQAVISDSSGFTINTMLLPTEPGIFLFGDDAQACFWALDNDANDGVCLDATLIYDDAFGIYYCIYQHKCARPNYFGQYITSPSISSMHLSSNDNNSITIPKRQDGLTGLFEISFPPSLSEIYGNIKNTTGFIKSIIQSGRTLSRLLNPSINKPTKK